MLSLPSSVRIFLAVEPVDMRGSFDSLAGAARRLGLAPAAGHLYLCLNRRRVVLKLLFFDGSAWCLFARRLEQGTFQLPALPAGQGAARIDPTTFAMVLEGIDLRHARRRKRYEKKVGRE